MFLDTSGAVKSYQKVSSLSGNFNNTIPDNDAWALSLSSPGDLDDNGVQDILVGSTQNDDGGTDRGALWILYMKSDGTVKSSQKISSNTTGMTTYLSDFDNFGVNSTYIKDLNNDGLPEIIVGSHYGDDGASNAGALYVIFTDKNFTTTDLSSNHPLFSADTLCFDSSINIPLSVSNKGDVSVSKYSIKYTINGDSNITIYKTYTNSFSPHKDSTIYTSIPISKAGVYNLTAHIYDTGDNNPYNDIANESFIVVQLSPGFIYSGTCSGDSVEFTDVSVSKGIADINSHNWNFGDGSSSTLTNPKHHFTNPGEYSVTLKIGSINGCSQVIIKKIQILKAPIANFDASDYCVGFPATFINKSTTDSGKIVSAFWDFGDGTTSDSMNVVHLYKNSGTYKVKLIAGNSIGCYSDTFSREIIVNATPTASFYTGGACEGDSVIFSNTSKNGIKYDWDFGDNFHSSQMSPYHFYKNPGEYRITLKVYNVAGCMDSFVTRTRVYMSPKITFTPINNCLGESTTIKEKIQIDSQSKISNIIWNFGDGKTGFGNSPEHTYSSPGKYLVSLRVLTDIGCESTYKDSIQIFPKPSESYKRSNDTLSVSKGYKSYQWYFNYAPIPGETINNLVIKDSGYYTVLLTSEGGCSDSAKSTFEAPTITGISSNRYEFNADLFPNPTNGQFIMNFNVPIAHYTVQLTDMAGRIVYNEYVDTPSSQHLLNINKLTSGLYFMHIYSDNVNYTAKIFKE